MGRIRSDYIRRISSELYQAYPSAITDNFESNKQLLKQIAEFQSKSLRNRVAGFLITLKLRETNPYISPYKGIKKEDLRKKKYRNKRSIDNLII